MRLRHRQNIDLSFSIIASRVDMHSLWPKLMEYEIFTRSNLVLKHWLPSLNDLITKKDIILNIKTSRTRNAYYYLLMSLRDCGYQDEADFLEGSITLVLDSSQASAVLDLSLETNENAVGEQQEDPKERAEPKAKRKFFVQVQNAKQFRDLCHSPLDIPRYRMRSNPRGAVLIITLIDYENYGKRHGAEVDDENLAQLFKQMGFIVFQGRFNLTAQEIKEEVKRFSQRRLLNNVDSCFVIISGHGRQCPVNGEFIIGSDFYTQPEETQKYAVVSVDELLQFFTSENCPQLKGKPKVFISQTCRGPLEQRSRDILCNEKISKDGPCDGSVTDRVTVQEPREYDDMLIVHATQRGYKSYRHEENGSWFIQIFCEVFMEYAWYHPIHDLLSIVDQQMQERYKQISQTTSYEYRGFNKHLYINPGLFEKSSENLSSPPMHNS